MKKRETVFEKIEKLKFDKKFRQIFLEHAKETIEYTIEISKAGFPQNMKNKKGNASKKGKCKRDRHYI